MPSPVGTTKRNGKSARVAVEVETNRWILEDRYGDTYEVRRAGDKLTVFQHIYNDDTSDWDTVPSDISIRDLFEQCNIDGLA